MNVVQVWIALKRKADMRLRFFVWVSCIVYRTRKYFFFSAKTTLKLGLTELFNF